jgi:hypothetical protein
MTVQTTDNKAGPFDGNDVSTSFPFAFKTLNDANLEVVFTDSLGTESILVKDTDFSVVLNGDQDNAPGGTVTYPIAGDPLATGEKLTLRRIGTPLQELDLINQGAYNPEEVEAALDVIILRVQEHAEQLARSIKVPISSDLTVDELLQSIYDAATAAGNSEAAAAASELAAANSAAAALASETAAGLSETAAGLSEAAAAASETAAGLSEAAAASSETAAGLSEAAAAASETAAGISESNAAGSELAAGISESNAAGSELAAGISESNAAASETRAGEWAEQPEDVEVLPGQFSALHHAAKAATFNPASFPALYSRIGTDDMDDMVEPGMHRLSSGHPNMPAGFDFGNLLVVRGLNTPDTLVQLLFDYDQNRIATRTGNPTQAGGVGSWAPWSTMAFINSTFAGYQENMWTNSSLSGSVSLNSLTDVHVANMTLIGNVTISAMPGALGGGVDGRNFSMVVKQDATGGRTMAFPASVKWPGGTAPTLSTGANAIDVLSFVSYDNGTTWLGFVGGQDFQ